MPLQGQDGGDWGLEKIRYCDDHDYMNIQYALKRAIIRPYHTFYQVTVFCLLQSLSMDYITKMTYNRDKDIIFVNRPGFFREYEEVYEVHHIEQPVPQCVSAFKDIGGQYKDGIMTLHCLNTKDNIKVYNESKYWNME